MTPGRGSALNFDFWVREKDGYPLKCRRHLR